MDKMTVKFPHNETVDFEFGKPIVLLGANGAGKTRFSVKIEELNDPAFKSNQIEKSHIHRLCAQKSLTLDTTIHIYDHESSEKNLFFSSSGISSDLRASIIEKVSPFSSYQVSYSVATA